MKIVIASILLLATVASAQSVRGATVQHVRASRQAAGNAAVQAQVAPAAVDTPAAAGPAATVAPVAPTYGPAFFGPGINNPIARVPFPQLIQRAQEVVATNPNVRVFLDVDGTIEFTDQFGREVEVLDSFGRDALEIPGLEEQLELQKQQIKIQQRRALLMQQLNALNQFAPRAAGGHGARGGVAASPVNRFIIAQ